MDPIVVVELGKKGVDVDSNPLELDPQALRKCQNAVTDPSTGTSTLRKRPGLTPFDTLLLGGQVLGGSPLPGPNLSPGASTTIYIGRSSLS